VNADGRIEVFAIGYDTTLNHISQTAPGGPWSSWAGLGGAVLQIATAVNADGRIEVFAIATNQALFHVWQTTPGGGWSGWESLGGAVLQIATAANGDGRIEVFAIATNQALFHIWQATPTVQITNLTHPAISPNFEVGDTFQIRVWGPPYQPVYRSEALNGSSSTIQIGTTDAAGHLQITGTETTSQTGTYTDVYSVGSTQAMPTISYVVAQSGGVGWVASGERGQTPDGHVSGLSYLSISNGSSIWTSSTTYLDYAASAYYDTQTVATLYQNGQAIQQGVATGSSYASGSLSATAIPWNDYTLQTDHYVVAFFAIGLGFYNPFYLGDGSCAYASSDCSIGIGTGPILVIAASIYLGSTLADQTNVPYSAGLILPGRLPSGVSNTSDMQIALRIMALVAAAAIFEAHDIGKISDPPVPAFVELVDPPAGDSYQPNPIFANGVERQRVYIVKDSYGRRWEASYPLLVRERFVKISLLGSLPDQDGEWTSRASGFTFPNAQIINPNDSSMLDFHGFSGFFSVKLNQYYYASNFQTPSWWNFLSYTASWPLFVVDAWNTCAHGSDNPTQYPAGVPIPLPGQTIYLTPTGVGFDGDSGPPPRHNGCSDPTYP
jgi:hypothetical protein